jgi:hypothetical protein
LLVIVIGASGTEHFNTVMCIHKYEHKNTITIKRNT